MQAYNSLLLMGNDDEEEEKGKPENPKIVSKIQKEKQNYIWMYKVMKYKKIYWK